MKNVGECCARQMNYMLWGGGGGGGGGGPNKKMGVNQWDWDTCPIL